MGPVRQNPIQRTVRTAHLSVLMTVLNFQNTIQHRTEDNLPSSGSGAGNFLNDEYNIEKDRTFSTIWLIYLWVGSS